MGERINKYIAECGVSSRRGADKLISEGRVKINNKLVTELGVEVNTQNDTVTVDGRIVKPESNTYIMLNKPKGCVCTSSDEDKDRKTVFDYVDIDKRLFSIGRLDYDSEGLLLFTNDGDLAHRLTHPSNEIPKTYIVKIEGEVPQNDLAMLRKGVLLDGVLTTHAKIKLIKIEEGGVYRYEMTLFEGKNREIRRMFESIEKKVLFLKRISIGDLRMGGLGRGKYRYLNDAEVLYLKNM